MKESDLMEELKETPADEKAESAEMQAKEKKEGTEIHDSEGNIIPEALQKAVHSLIASAPKSHVEHVRKMAQDKLDEMQKAEREEEMKEAKLNGPSEFSTAEMPSSY